MPQPATNGDVLIGTRKGLFRLRGGTLEHVAFLGAPVVNAIRDPRDGRIHAALNHEHFGCKLHYSDNDGATWIEAKVPEYPQPPDGTTEVDPVRGEPIAWSTKMVWTIEPGHPDTPGVMWAGTVPGGLFRSTDRGESWSLVDGFWANEARAQWMGGGFDDPGLHSISIDPRDPDTLAVGLSAGGVWVTHDGGDTWVPGLGMNADFVPPDQADNPAIQDPHRLSRCADHPDTIWVQHHCGMFLSRDGGEHWAEVTDVKPSNFGFAVAAHPHDADTAWFVPAISDEVRVPVDGNVVVNRTTDGGRTFETFTDGLPQGNAWHLTYRHALAVDDAGERLVFGSTTGGLWASADAGEHWQQLSNDLPPVLSVSFA